MIAELSAVKTFLMIFVNAATCSMRGCPDGSRRTTYSRLSLRERSFHIATAITLANSLFSIHHWYVVIK